MVLGYYEQLAWVPPAHKEWIDTELHLEEQERFEHVYIQRETGTRNSTLMLRIIIDHMRNCNGYAVIDPTVKLVEHALRYVQPERIKDVILFDPADIDFPIGLNLVGRTPKKQRNLATERILSALKKFYQQSWGIQLERIWRNALRLHFDLPGVTILSIYKMLVEATYHNPEVSTECYWKEIAKEAKDPVNWTFWNREFKYWTHTKKVEAITPVLNRLEQLLHNPMLRNVFGQVKSWKGQTSLK